MSNLSTIIKSIQDIMRQDSGVDGDAQRLSQLTWLLFITCVCVNMRQKFQFGGIGALLGFEIVLLAPRSGVQTGAAV